VSSYRAAEKKLAKAQRKLARMIPRSHNGQKQKRRIRKVPQRIATIRLNHLHPITHGESKNHALIVTLDLDIVNMSAWTRGTVDSPGTQGRQKSALNKEILDQGWGECKRQIAYKGLWRGVMVLLAPSRGIFQPGMLAVRP